MNKSQFLNSRDDFYLDQSYTMLEHQTWSILLDEAFKITSKIAYKECLLGFEKLGLKTRTIPAIASINERLIEYGWKVVPVFGFLPPRDYLSSVAKRELPIAINMRSLKMIDFNPEPDIFHEAFGHLPLLTNESYGNFLQNWAKVSMCAFQSSGEQSYYNEIRKRATILSQANGIHEFSQVALIESEATMIARFGWWTVECGLLKTEQGFKVYGAAILSSLKECSAVLSNSQKIRLCEKALFNSFDPTKIQPSYYYIENFDELSQLLNSISKKMAYKVGGVHGLEVAKASEQQALLLTKDGNSFKGIISDFKECPDSGQLEIQIRINGSDESRSIVLQNRSELTSVRPVDSEGY